MDPSAARLQLIAVLVDASSQQPDRLKQAELQLKQWETAPEFYASLQDIVYDKSLDLSIRWISAIYLKNGIDRYWRRTAKNAIQHEEKAKIRGRLLTALDEEHKQLAIQNAVVVSKIARLDFPNDWPDILHRLLQIIQQTSTAVSASNPTYNPTLVQQRALLTLHLVVKALCSKTLATGRTIYKQVAPELFRHIAELYARHIQSIFQALESGGVNNDNIVNVGFNLETTALSLKCMRRLLSHGFDDFSKTQDTREFFVLSLSHLRKFRDLLKSMSPDSDLYSSFSTHIILIGKVYLNLQQFQLVPFIRTPGMVEVMQWYWRCLVEDGEKLTDRNPHPELSEKFLVQALILWKNIIKNYNYTPSRQEAIEEARKFINDNILTPSFVHSCAEVLISRFLVLRPEDLASWESDPEGWMNDEEADHWEYQLRPCSEKVFMDLLTSKREQLAPTMLSLLENVAKGEGNLLLKDAVYCAIGLGANDLFDVLDFDGFLVNHLAIEVNNLEQNYRILRRRIAWMIGKWISVKISKVIRPQVYTMLLRLISPETEPDLVVRLTAVTALRSSIDEWDFEADSFSPFLRQTVADIARLLQDVDEFDSRMRILNCLSMVIERMEGRVIPFAQEIVGLLPPLWNAAGEEHLFKSAILVTLTKLIGSLKEQSSNLHEIVVPLIQHSTDPNQPAHVYLIEDGLELWTATVHNAPRTTPELFGLIPVAVALLEYGSENLRKVLRILESYALLNGELLVQSFSLPIFDGFARLLGDLKPQACNVIIRVLDTILQKSPVNTYSDVMINSGLLWKLLGSILENKESPLVLVSYFSVFSRIIVDNTEFFYRFIDMASRQCNPPRPELLGMFLDIWLDKFDNIGHPKQRKLNAMAFSSLIASTDEQMLARLDQIIGVWCSVLSEVRESESGDALIYWRQDGDLEESGEEREDSPEQLRKRELLRRDPIHTTNLISLIQIKLHECEHLNGGAENFRAKWLVRVDSLLLDQLHSLLS
ncbi:uncharacterized protein VTP21DRAFT_8052 [Calcarisporiella thermophila]|uniref:uncharacterized protein n=1 Tax=Calcarisporiella thermophila TaxID=911321 RepID=UPI003742BC18